MIQMIRHMGINVKLLNSIGKLVSTLFFQTPISQMIMIVFDGLCNFVLV